MNQLVTYEIGEQIYSGPNTWIYRALRRDSGQPVVLKVLNQAHPLAAKIAQFKLEYEIISALDLPGVVRAYDLGIEQGHWMMVLEDFGGEALTTLLPAAPLLLGEFLALAIPLVDTIGQLHAQRVIHKDINPANIVLNQHTGQLKLIDFGLASRLSQETQSPRHPNRLEGTLAYMSPEQTGRMNRGLDHRTDFYSLGVTFYQLLTGQLPFPTDDALMLVHSHLARQPLSPCDLNPTAPKPVAEIIMRLLAKNAEERYQSAFSLKRDLETCLRQWQATGQIDPFPLHQQDVSSQFQVAQQLFGREAEIEQLLAAFARVSQGASEAMMVTGYAGIGKSALVQEVYKPITERCGYFIAGKFDQMQRDIPYASLIQAFGQLVRQLLTESETAIAGWRAKLLAALEDNGQVLIDVMPEVELIIGAQPAVPHLPPAEAHNRFHHVLQNFVRVFTQPEHPLVLFLDDLQWADNASLHLLELFMTAADSAYLFLIGAYRTNEVDEGHPLTLTLQRMRAGEHRLLTIELAPLALPHVTQLVADTLRTTCAEAESLARLVLAKTDGNPFFINEFLRALHVEGHVRFDDQQVAWRWDVRQIQARTIADNVVELMAVKVKKLNDRAQTVLKLAACIGNEFDLQTLSLVHQQSPQASADALWEALEMGVVVPLGDAYRLVGLDVQGLVDELTVEYKFAHDQIQRAAYQLIPEPERQTVHRTVGRLLLQGTSPEEREQKIFAIVNQLNLGKALLEQPAEREELAELNLLAGKRAKSAAAYQSAVLYLYAGLDLLDAGAWRHQYQLALTLHLEAAEAAYLHSDFDRMEQLLDIVLKEAQTLLDKVKAYEIKIQAAIARNQLQEAVATALPVLGWLGVSFPAKPNTLHVLRGLLETKLVLLGKEPAQLLELPPMQDPSWLATMRLLSKVISASYLTDPLLFALVILKQITLSVRHGNTVESAKAYAMYGVILNDVNGDIETSDKFAQLALALLDRLNAREAQAQVYMGVYLFLKPWKDPLRSTLVPLYAGYQSGLATGDTEFAAYLIGAHAVFVYYAGEHVDTAEAAAAAAIAAAGRLKQERTLFVPRIYRQIALNLQGRGLDPARLTGEAYDDETMPSLHREARDITGHLYVSRLFLAYLFQQNRQAVDYAAEAERHLDGLKGIYFAAMVHFYAALARLALFPEASRPERKIILKQVRTHQSKLKQWAKYAPMNFLHKWYLVDAERARVMGDHKEARTAYEQAIKLAHEHEFTSDEALAHELAARFYADRQDPGLASFYLRNAHSAYLQWGAVAKVTALEARHPELAASAATTSNGGAASATADSQASSMLDLKSLLKAFQAISSEIVLDTLLARLMEIVIENAGAQKGFLLLPYADGWTIAAEGMVDQDGAPPAVARPALGVLRSPSNESSAAHMPIGVINFVARTHEPLVLNDTAREDAFRQDPYVVAHQPQSVLCMPLIYQRQLTGLLYLENNLTAGAFTAERVAVLNALCSQAAISIENARLYDNLTVSEQRFRTLFENAPLGLFEIDLSPETPVILAANHQAEEMYGWSASELAGLPADRLAPSEALAQMRQLFQPIQSGHTVALETTSLRRNGVTFPVRISATPQAGPARNRLIVTVEDITLEKQRQAEIEAIEAERRRIAHEIHDGLAQDLAALRFKTTLWHDLVDRSPTEMHAELDELMAILNASIREVRRSIFALRPIALDEQGFFNALRQFCSHFGEQYQLRIALEVLGPEERLASAVELPLFRVVQEALNNVRKHAQASAIDIRLDLQDTAAINLSIHDNGVGFELSTMRRALREGHVGLKQMEERIKSINGSLHVQSAVGQGTTIHVVLPGRGPTDESP
ncbi:MAG: AAA family ATPase [Caldilineaceae bacterium]|nr:AAA family ATPase [Caldilineaceae bacterium]